MLMFVSPANAQYGGYVPFAWEQADLALLVPPEWSASSILRDDQPALEITGEEGIITLWALADTTLDEDLRPSLEAAFRALDLLPASYEEVMWFGQRGLRVISNGQPPMGVGRIGRLPDRRVIVIAGRNLPESELNAVANSIVFSTRSAPTPPSYALVWRSQLPQPNIIGLAYGSSRQIYVVDGQQGVSVFDATTGSFLVTYPFINPMQPTSIAVDSSGTIYVGDTICRCVQVLANRAWREPLGNFAEGAPFHLSIAPNGTLYAVDRSDEGYIARVFSGGSEHAVPLNFNAAAPPYLSVDSAGQVRVIEWLSSLIDNQISGAVSRLEDESPALQYWLDISPNFVTNVATDPTDHLVLALSDGRIALVDSQGELSETAHEDSAPRAIAFAPDGTLFLALEDGTIAARSTSLSPERTGDGSIIHDLPVQGTLTEEIARQEWRYEGSVGEQITISAVDLTRTDALDMAVRLIGPDGGERAYNDDQLGVDLYGRFDAQIDDFVLRDTGTYTIAVEWVQGAGTYTLGVSDNRHFELSADVAARLEGHLQDVFPTQRWVFDGHAGQVVTFTMFGDSGNLDPALELVQPGGSTLAYNDDAYDPELGVNAQLFRIELPDDGVYVLEASRFEGTGDYSIVALVNGQ